jgi:Icc-related predicted phosphoesterase
MRLRILSDLHMEFGAVQIPPVDCDAVVLAGDISTKLHGVRWAIEQWPTTPVVYVLGNHEYYGAKFPKLIQTLRDAAEGTQVHILENETVTIGGFQFFGATLWTDLELNSDWLTGAAEAGPVMNDYKRIRNSDVHYRHLHAGDTRRQHLKTRAALATALAGGNASRTIVVTHHAPSPLSLPEKRRPDLISCAYASRLEGFIHEHQPPLWIHGHIHHSNDYQLESTRVLANPRGYPDEPNRNFKPDLIVDL